MYIIYLSIIMYLVVTCVCVEGGGLEEIYINFKHDKFI